MTKAVNVLINEKTGEVIEDYGTFISDKQKELIKKAKEHRELINEKYKEYGSFTWFLYNVNTMLNLGIKPANLTRLIYLSTYMNYENELIFDNHISITKDKLSEVLKLGKTMTNNFYKEMIKHHIFNCKDDKIFLSKSLFQRGRINKSMTGYQFTRFYKNGIRKLYENAKISEHKQLSYGFQILPFVNIQYNIVCKNPMETNLKNIAPLTLQEMCDIINYDKTNVYRLKENFKRTTVDNRPFVHIVDDIEGYKAFINPKVYYGGDKWNEVKVLGAFDNTSR